MVNILLCGGSGVRLWPLSREKYPKQFCSITGEYSLFQETLLRNKDICSGTIIVTNERHYSLAKAQIKKFNYTFGGSLSNDQTQRLVGVSRGAFYKYKNELLNDSLIS